MRRFRSRAELRAIFAKLHNRVAEARVGEGRETWTDDHGRTHYTEAEWAKMDGDTWDREARQLYFERIRFEARDGTRVLEKTDYRRNAIGFSGEEMTRLRKVPGLTMTHNHPNGSAFSLEDYAMGYNLDTKRMRVVGRTGFTYTIESKTGLSWDQITAEDQATYKKALAFSKEQVQGGLMSSEEGTRDTLHNWWTAWAKRHPRMSYTRTGTYNPDAWKAYWKEVEDNR